MVAGLRASGWGEDVVAEPSRLTKEALHQIIQMQPGTESAARAHFQLGSLHLDGGEIETATASYRQVPPSWPRWHARAGFAIARIYETHLSDIEAAAREYRKVISLHPESMSAAQSYVRLSELHALVGDPVSAENMRECAMRTYERLAETGEDHDERDEARYRFAVASRELQRWDQATEALLTCRKRAVRHRDAARRYDIDRQLGLVYLEREQPGNAVKRFKDCLEYARRRSDTHAVVELSTLIARCHEAAGDETAARRAWRSLVEFVHRGKKRLAEAQVDPAVAPVLLDAYLRLDQEDRAKALRTRLRRLRSKEARELLAVVEARMEPPPEPESSEPAEPASAG
jgi:Tfp pilus assembly protein PilF